MVSRFSVSCCGGQGCAFRSAEFFDLASPAEQGPRQNRPGSPGTALQGPDTNLAGLFQLNGVANVGGKAEAWNTWQVGKRRFGTGHSSLTAYVVAGTAPTVVSAETKPVSNVVRVPFSIVP